MLQMSAYIHVGNHAFYFLPWWSARHCWDEWEVKWNDSVLGLGPQQQVWVAWYGTSATIPIIQSKCVDNVPGQHPSLQPSPQFGAISAQLAAWWPGNCRDQMRLQKIGNCSPLYSWFIYTCSTCEDHILSLWHYYKLPSCHTIKLFMNLKLLLEDSHNKSST